MDNINEIRLQNPLIAALYPHSLVEDVLITKEQKNNVKYLGNNARKITVLVDCPDHTFLPENELGFLTKMLGACNLNAGDVAIVNMATSSWKKEDIFIELSPEKVIDFTEGASESVPNKNIQFISSPAIYKLMNETAEAKNLKGRLWTSLKQMFGI